LCKKNIKKWEKRCTFAPDFKIVYDIFGQEHGNRASNIPQGGIAHITATFGFMLAGLVVQDAIREL
jgi:hypothetical protein